MFPEPTKQIGPAVRAVKLTSYQIKTVAECLSMPAYDESILSGISISGSDASVSGGNRTIVKKVTNKNEATITEFKWVHVFVAGILSIFFV